MKLEQRISTACMLASNGGMKCLVRQYACSVMLAEGRRIRGAASHPYARPAATVLDASWSPTVIIIRGHRMAAGCRLLSTTRRTARNPLYLYQPAQTVGCDAA